MDTATLMHRGSIGTRIARRLRHEISYALNPIYGSAGVPIDRVRYLLRERPRLRELKGIHTGKRCFILGNGPSIARQDLRPLGHEYTFAANWFLLHALFFELDIKYYCVSDAHLLWVKGSIPGELAAPLAAAARTTIFLNREARPIVERSNPFGRDPYYVWMEDTPKVETGVFSSDIADRVFHGRTVIINLCIPIACYMGFSEIYLLGCDCDYDLDVPAEQRQDHFYDEDVVRRFGDYSPMSKKDLEIGLDNHPNYRAIERVLRGTGQRIFNAGVGGRLDVFPRRSLEEALAAPGPAELA